LLYRTLRSLHLACVTLTLGGILLRGGWMLASSPLLEHRLTRILPHLVDTLLLLSGAGLAVLTSQYPLAQPWLTAKLLALLVYVLLGTVALKRGRTKAVRGLALTFALVCLGYILGTALTRNPWPFA